MKIKFVGMKSARIPDLGIEVVRGQIIDAPLDIAEKLIITGHFEQVKETKKEG